MAVIQITAPANTAVLPAGQPATVTWTTDRPDLSYVIEPTDAAGNVTVIPAAATGSSPMGGTIPVNKLPANGTFDIRVKPVGGNKSAAVEVTTGPANPPGG